jgi:hypothetical protein
VPDVLRTANFREWCLGELRRKGLMQSSENSVNAKFVLPHRPGPEDLPREGP